MAQLVLVLTSSVIKQSRIISSNIAVFVCASIFGQFFMRAFHRRPSGKSWFMLCTSHNAIAIISDNQAVLSKWPRWNGKFWKCGSVATVADDCFSDICAMSKLWAGLLGFSRDLHESKPFRRYSHSKLDGSQWDTLREPARVFPRSFEKLFTWLSRSTSKRLLISIICQVDFIVISSEAPTNRESQCERQISSSKITWINYLKMEQRLSWHMQSGARREN